MRHPRAPFVLGVVLAAAAACADSASRLVAPDASSSLAPSNGPSLSQGSTGNDKITICHAAGRLGTTHYVEITVSTNASYAHLGEHGTPMAGHEEDYIEPAGQTGCSGVTGTFVKRLRRVYTMLNDQMIQDPAWVPGQPIPIPVGQTRWVEYELVYSLIPGVTGTITESHDGVCATVSPGMHCGFNTGGVYSWTVSGSGTILVDIDLSNDTACGMGAFTNTAVLTPSVGTQLTGVVPSQINLICP